MAMNIERLLRITADYHKFCSGDYEKANKSDSEELSLEELDLVAAATGVPTNEPNQDSKNGSSY